MMERYLSFQGNGHHLGSFDLIGKSEFICFRLMSKIRLNEIKVGFKINEIGKPNLMIC